MGNVTSHGLDQEQRVLEQLSLKYGEQMEPRGVNATFRVDYKGLIDRMEASGKEVRRIRVQLRRLTSDEESLRENVAKGVHAIRDSAKNVFKDGSPELKQFHVGDSFKNSTPLMLKMGRNVVAAWDQYKTQLLANGSLQQDRDDLVTALSALEAKDTEQERVKLTDSPEATAKFNTDKKAVQEKADWLHNVAATAFAKNPAVLNEFAQAKKKRYEPPPRGDDDHPDAPPPTQPPQTPPQQ